MMASYEDELINILLSNADLHDTPFYKYTEETLYEIKDLILEKFGIGYETCDGCGEYKPVIFTEEGTVYCHTCCEKLAIE
jgi:hypothetical protein